MSSSWKTLLLPLALLLTLQGTGLAAPKAEVPGFGSPRSDAPALSMFHMQQLNESSTKVSDSDPSSHFKMPSLHKYFGYGAVLFGGAAALSGSDDDLHHAAGVTAGSLGLAALLTGIIENRVYIDLTDGLQQYDYHAILGGLAAAGMATAVVLATNDRESHPGLAAPAVVTAAVAIVIVRW